MTRSDRDRLVALRKARKGLITQRQAAEELGISVRQVRRLVMKRKAEGDKVVIHGLRGQRSNRRLSEATRERVIQVLSQLLYRGFGPTLASEHLARRHNLRAPGGRRCGS